MSHVFIQHICEKHLENSSCNVFCYKIFKLYREVNIFLCTRHEPSLFVCLYLHNKYFFTINGQAFLGLAMIYIIKFPFHLHKSGLKSQTKVAMKFLVVSLILITYLFRHLYFCTKQPFCFILKWSSFRSSCDYLLLLLCFMDGVAIEDLV